MSTNVGDLYLKLKMDVKDLRKGVATANKTLRGLDKTTAKTNKTFKQFGNDTVRFIRQLETAVVAYYAISTAIKHAVGAGLELNKMYEDQSLGIAALTSSKITMIDSTGKELDSYEKFLATQSLTKDVMEDIKKAALETPASFQEMIGFYQQTIGHAITANNTFGKSFGAVNDNVITFTQRMSALGSSMGMDMRKINEEIRSLMSGNASTDSLLAMVLFGSPTAANEAVRNAKKSTEGLSNLLLNALEPFKHVEGVQTYSKTMAQLSAALDELRKNATGGLFQDIKRIALNLTGDLRDNMDALSTYWEEFYGMFRAEVIQITQEFGLMRYSIDEIFDSLGIVEDSFEGIIGGTWTWHSALMAIKQLVVLISGSIGAIAVGIRGVRMIAIEAQVLTNTYNDLSESEERSLKRSERMIKSYEEGTKQYQRHADTIDKLTKKKNDTAAADKAIAKLNAKNVEWAEKYQKALKDNFSDEGRKAQKARLEALSQEYPLLRQITEAKDEASRINAVLIAQTNANGDATMLKAIGDEYKNIAAQAEQAARVAKIVAKATGTTGGSGGGKGAAKAAKKSAKAASKASEDNYKAWYKWRKKQYDMEQKLLKQEADDKKNYSLDMMDSLSGVMGASMNGDMIGIFDSIADGFLSSLEMMEQGYGLFSGILDGITLKSGWGFALKGISMAMNAFGGGTTEEMRSMESYHVESDSLQGALSDIYNVQYPMLKLTRDMRGYLEIMSKSFGGIESSLLVSGSDIGGNNIRDFKNLSLEGTSITMGGATLGDIMTGGLNTILTLAVERTSKNWLGNTSSEFLYVTQDISNQFSAYLADAAGAVMASFREIGSSLGISTAGLSDMRLSIGEIDTTGMNPDEIAAAIEARFSAEMDAIANVLFGSVAEFQRAGEGLAQTAYRVSITYDQVSHALGLIGSDVNWRSANILTDVAGGLDALNSALTGYTDNFFTDQEKFDMMYETMGIAFEQLNRSMPTSNAGFRALVESIDTTTDEGAKLFAELMLLAGGFNDLTEAQEALNEANDTAQELLDERMRLGEIELAFHQGILKRIEDAYMGANSYLNSVEKIGFLASVAEVKLESGDTQGYFDTLYSQLELEKKMSITREEYIPTFEQYINELKIAEPEKTTDDVVKSLMELLNQNIKIEEAILRASFQGVI